MLMKSKTTICRNCNAQIAKDAKNCPSCGAKNKKPFYKRTGFILLMIILVIGVISFIGKNKREKFDWNEVEFCERLPKPKSNVGTIYSNDNDTLSIQVAKTSKSDYKAYVEECKFMGYTVESENDGECYDAFDVDGYALSLDYIGGTMYIELEAPTEMGTLNWPKSEIAGLLPMPKSTVGKISTDTAEGCCIYVGETSIDDFNIYADECSQIGFSVDYERGDKFYNAEDENGNQLSLSYQGNNVMIVQIRKIEETEVEETNAGTETSAEPKQEEGEEKLSTETQLIDGMRPEFKEAMDSYEMFMNEYCDFMKKYAESNGTDLDLLADYTEYMSKYTDVMGDFEALGNEEMNTAEMAYYLEVQTRINEKLLEIE